MREAPGEIYWIGKKTWKMHLFSCNSQEFMTISSWNNLFFLLFLNLLNQLGNINKSINTLFDFFPAENL
jgi:hypothetical protein